MQNTAMTYDEKAKKIYDDDIIPKHDKLRLMEEDHKKKMAHIETVTSMTKY